MSLTSEQEKIRGRSYWLPCDAHDNNSEARIFNSFNNGDVHYQRITMSDIKAAIAAIRESANDPVLGI